MEDHTFWGVKMLIRPKRPFEAAECYIPPQELEKIPPEVDFLLVASYQFFKTPKKQMGSAGTTFSLLFLGRGFMETSRVPAFGIPSEFCDGKSHTLRSKIARLQAAFSSSCGELQHSAAPGGALRAQ